jgi:hypothetical protein
MKAITVEGGEGADEALSFPFCLKDPVRATSSEAATAGAAEASG